MRIRKVSAAKWSALGAADRDRRRDRDCHAGERAGSFAHGHDYRYDGRRAARRDGDCSAHRHRQHLRRCDRRGRRVPPARAGRGLPRVCRAFRLCRGRPHDLVARRTNGARESADVDGRPGGIGHRQRSRRRWSTPLFHRRQAIDPRQVRSSGERTQLGRPCHAGARQPPERVDRRAGDAGGSSRRGNFSAQRRRPARHPEPDRRLRPAEVQQRRHRRVRVRRRPLRCDPGRLDAARWSTPSPSRARTALSGTFSGYFRRRLRSIAEDFVARTRAALLRQQLSWTLGGPIRRTACTSSATTSTSASRRPSIIRARIRASTSITRARAPRRRAGVRLDYQFSPRLRLSVRGNKSIVDMPYDQRYTGGATRTRRRQSPPTATAATSASR